MVVSKDSSIRQYHHRQHHFVEYPLKVVEIEQFFLNFDHLVWQKVTKDLTSIVKCVETKNQTLNASNQRTSVCCCGCYPKCSGCSNSECCSSSRSCADELSEKKNNKNENDDEYEIRLINDSTTTTRPVLKKRSGVQPPNLALEYNSTPQSLTLLFIDSDVLRQTFEKSHLKLVNNIIVLDR